MPDRPPPKIDRELSRLLEPLGADEVLQLENNLLADGEAISPIVVWEETNLIIDGNYRFYLCTKYNLPYQIKYKSFASRGAVIGWIISHHLGRRNLTPQQCGFAEAAMSARAAGIYHPE